MGIVKEFKDFAMRGNVMDMAVGIIIGAAFGKIVASLVKDIVMPAVGKLVGGVDFTTLSYSLGGDSKLMYGNFLQTVFDFIVVAFAIFMMIKLMNKAQEKANALAGVEEEEKKAATPAEDILLLREIRDSLNK